MTNSAPAESATAGLRARGNRWLLAVVRTARPLQWPKNLLVFAAPLAGASLGRDNGLAYALVAFAGFVAASSAVYFVNDVLDAENDRAHPVKRHRPVASGQLRKAHALTLAAACAVVAEASGVCIREPRLCVIIAVYLVVSVLYSIWLKRVPVVELALVASGFVLRALGGAIATHVPPSRWFLLVCTLGALLVATAKRAGELRVLGQDVASHRPVLRWYTPAGLRISQRAIAVIMVLTYLLWALGDHAARMRGWHLASALPLAAALVRFERLSARSNGRPVEDLMTRDVPMLCLEAAWLALFVTGL